MDNIFVFVVIFGFSTPMMYQYAYWFGYFGAIVMRLASFSPESN